MESYAAIEITRDNLDAIFASVGRWPAGRARLAWAFFTYPYHAGKFFFIGGNYLHLNQPDFSRQILSLWQLDKLFTYDPSQVNKNKSAGGNYWFTVSLKE